MAPKTTKTPARRTKKKAARGPKATAVKRRTPKRKAKQTPKEATRENGRQPKDRWTATLVADGWTPVSDFFLKSYSSLKPEITSLEAMFVVQLMTFKWTAEAPWPGFKKIAQRMGVSTTSARGYARRLDNKGYLRREFRKGRPNVFHLDPLFHQLEAHRKAQPPKKRQPTPEDDPYADFR